MKNFKDILISISFLLIFQIQSFSQESKFEYWEELCSCVGVFDSTKYSREELKNTFEYLWWAPNVDYDATPNDINKIKNLNRVDLEKECSNKLEKLRTLNFVDTKFWIKVKEDRIKEIESTCKLRKFTTLAYENPSILLSYVNVDSTCIYYRNILIKGGQEMIGAWVKFHNENQMKNGFNKNNQEKFESQYNSTFKEDYARLYLTTYGWWNSANHLIFHINTSNDYSKEFKKLFIIVDFDCDEP